MKTRTRADRIPHWHPPETPGYGCGGVAGSGWILGTPSLPGAGPALLLPLGLWLLCPGAHRTRHLQEVSRMLFLARALLCHQTPQASPPEASGLDHCPGWPQQGVPASTCHSCFPTPPTLSITSGSLTLSTQQLPDLIYTSSPGRSPSPCCCRPSPAGAVSVRPVATGNCLCRKPSPQSSLMLIDGQKYDIFWSLAGTDAGAFPTSGALWTAQVAGSWSSFSPRPHPSPPHNKKGLLGCPPLLGLNSVLALWFQE